MSKILVIDDDTIVRTTIVLLLEDAGHQVRSAEDGLRGMALFRSAQPDLVITDIIMPEQEGIQTITEMRKAKADAKIVAISGGARIGAATLPLMCGRFLRKLPATEIARIFGTRNAVEEFRSHWNQEDDGHGRPQRHTSDSHGGGVDDSSCLRAVDRPSGKGKRTH
jgi:CheY-like chemotaxis protein